MALPAITDYDSLLENAADYIARNDLDPYFQTFVQLTEKRLNSALKVPGMEAIATVNLDGTSLAGTIPVDYVEWISVVWHAASNGPSQRLRYVEPNSPEFTYRHRPNGNPQYYTVLAGAVRLAPSRAGSVEVAYYKTIPGLTPDNQTNWLIQKAPQLYLYGVLAEAYSFQKDEQNSNAWLQRSDERLMKFINESNSGKVGRRAERKAEEEAEVVAAKALN
ncbi:phage adaptor protein [Methylobacterium nonmethylotrophicum]|uniref:Uncharacterized protein n=1 Tax=Methylobacterium nonmethylotrophicum TaxID=1141884 RepID=A0A4Z0NFK7_9HYPH|nr:hypothetical protein [Methylobacterium nonmethylotrophicum]TGD94062.1 hypothetical protein EU555_32595 [Methylobacterium nonmethylotrophicum]